MKTVPCPSCGEGAQRETDTFDTFIDSSWYYARFTGLPEDQPTVKNPLPWPPVDQYTSGIEHAILHLLLRTSTPALWQKRTPNLKEPLQGFLRKAWLYTKPSARRTRPL